MLFPMTLGLTRSIKQGLERECVGTKFSKVIAGRSVCKLVLASFFSATCRAEPLEIPHHVRVSILKSLWVDVQRDKHLQHQIGSIRSLSRKFLKFTWGHSEVSRNANNVVRRAEPELTAKSKLLAILAYPVRNTVEDIFYKLIAW